MIEEEIKREKESEREEREKESLREVHRESEREREYREREREWVQGDVMFESETRGSQTRESRCVDSINVGVQTRV